MTSQRYRNKIEGMLASADIRIDGDRPWDIRVLDNDFYARVAAQGPLGAGESYMDGWWECDQLDEMICRAFRARLDRRLRPLRYLLFSIYARVRNLQRQARAAQVGQRHYNIDRDLYRAMLDKRMIYSCAYWKKASSLDEAQAHKLELVARKLQLEPGMRVLDIGCGWGGALRYLADKYGIEGSGITISEDQHAHASGLCEDLPVDIRLLDYRQLDGRFDRIFSLGMIEHVGYKNYGTYMSVVRRCLAPAGLFLLQTIGERFSTVHSDPWITRYIFPNSMLPSARHITKAAEGQLYLEDWHNFTADYDRTLMAWYANFERTWDQLKARYDERFYRMWRYYLLASAGAFRSGSNQLWQIVFSRDGIRGGYAAQDIR